MPRPGHSLLAALVATTAVVTASLCWAGWRLLDQQRAIDDQRAREQLENGADAIAAVVRGRLAEAGEGLTAWPASSQAPPPAIDRAIVIAIGPGQVEVSPKGAVPYVPVDRHPPSVTTAFASIETAEFAASSPAMVADRYRVLATQPDATVRAGALLRLGRVLRKAHDFAAAAAAYEQLAALGGVRTDDLPAELAGLEGQRATYLARNDSERERRVAAQIAKGLDEGRWLMTRGMAEFYRGDGEGQRPDSWLLADVVDDVWRGADGHLSARGQRVAETAAGPVLVLWRSNGDRTALLAAFAHAFLDVPSPGVTWRLEDPEGRAIAGGAARPSRSVARIIGNAEYPWTLHVGGASPNAGAAGNRRLLLAMLAAVLVFVWGATYVMARAIRREAAVARLQSDFVAAVSHEFRSPLTTMRQMAEMLEMNRLPSEERRQQYYGVLAGEAARLQRLVETLLNFGRMEAGAERFTFTEVDAGVLVRDVVRDIEPQARHAGTQIEMGAPASDIHVLADQNALALALRNLIDNAIKYSPRQSTVSVELKKEHDRAAISVSDRGTGIPPGEQHAIFQRFVRGRAAIDANVKGTGVGLSMVQHIVRAHGGEIRLDSEVGRGSTFTILLPEVRLKADATYELTAVRGVRL
jgi:signal transduction histidine kinase